MYLNAAKDIIYIFFLIANGTTVTILQYLSTCEINDGLNADQTLRQTFSWWMSIMPYHEKYKNYFIVENSSPNSLRFRGLDSLARNVSST
jgi:hypothetical protein